MSNVLQFNFHNIVGLRIITDDPQASEFFSAEYKFAQRGVPDNLPYVELQWKHAGFPLPVGPGYKFKVHKVLARWFYKVSISDQVISIDCIGNRWALPMVHHMLVHHSLRYLASLRGFLLLHAAAVVYQGQSLILTGPGGRGKTTTSSLILATADLNWQLHADDYVFLGERASFSYATRSHLYLDLLQWLPKLWNSLSIGERIRLLFLGKLRLFTHDGIKWPVRIEADRLWIERTLSTNASPAALVLLRRVDYGNTQVVPLHREDSPVKLLLEMNFEEASRFIRLLSATLPSDQLSGLVESWKHREEELLAGICESVPVRWLDLPRTPANESTYGETLTEALLPLFRNEGKTYC